MSGYHKYTPVRIAIPFILGIILAIKTEAFASSAVILMSAILVYACFLFADFLLRSNYYYRWLPGLLANLALLITGYCMLHLVLPENRTGTLPGGGISTRKCFICRISADPVRKPGMASSEAIMQAEMDSAGIWKPAGVKIRISFKADSLQEVPARGDLIVFSAVPDTIAGPSNPYGFDYRKYLMNRGVSRQVFLDSCQWKRLGNERGNLIMHYAGRCRGKFLEIFRKFRIEGEEFALVSALMFGTREFLDSETTREFSNAGAVHVLSVSGLHVGIMYVVADNMFFFLKRGRRGRRLHQVLIILTIWAYAFITGLPSSVVRASMMFSLLAAGRMFKRSTENYNIVSASAFLQLLINPLEITQIGFQLSYLAVVGIFAFYKPLNEAVNPPNRAMGWVWSVMSVSIAAQLSTFPLASHYFNMFPVYFLLTNLVVVPLAALITYFAVFLLIAGGSGIISAWLAWPLVLSLRFMSGSVEMIQSWPGAVIYPIVLTSGQVTLIYVSLVALFGFFVLRQKKWAFVLLASLVMVSFIPLSIHVYNHRFSVMTVYRVPGNTAIDLIHGRKAECLCDSLLTSDLRNIQFNIMPNRIYRRVRQTEALVLDGENEENRCSPDKRCFFSFRGKRIAVVGHGWPLSAPDSPLETDVAVIAGKIPVSPDLLVRQVKTQQIVIDSSVPYGKALSLAERFQSMGIPCHSVRQQGAFTLEWQ